MAAWTAARPGASRARGPARVISRVRGALCPPGRFPHRVGLGSGQRRDRRGQRGPVSADRLAGAGQDLGGGMRGGVERHALGRAARRLAAQVGPVPAVFHPQDVMHPQARAGHRVAGRVGDRGDQRPGAVPGDDDGGQLVAGQDAGGVRGDLGGGAGVGRVGEVVAQRDLDPAIRWSGAEDDEAGLGGEAEQVRDDREQAGRVADPDPRVLWLGVHRWFLP